MKRTFQTAVIALISVGCTHSVHVNHTSDYQLSKPLSEYRRIEARAEQKVILMSTSATYAREAYKDLMEQCEGGVVTGIQTRYSTSHGFLSWTNVIEMKGYCSQ